MKRKSTKRNRNIFLSIFLILFFFVFFTIIMEERLFPPFLEISHMQCKAIANDIIDEAVMKNIQSMDHTSLISQEEDNYTADTAMINHFCAMLSSDLTSELNKLPPDNIQIPLGAVTNLSFLANAGPEIPFSLVPMGSVKVDYETEFISAGINQINYKIWLNISMEMKIVNPLYHETLCMERKIMLADLIFSGKVPEHYFEVSGTGEYLLTE